MGEATHEDAPQQEHVVRIPYSLEIEDKLPRGMPYPHQVADQIAADMIASGQVRMQMWELLCDILPNGDPRRGLYRSSRQHVFHEWSLLARPTIWTSQEHHPATSGLTLGLQVHSFVHACALYELRAPTQYSDAGSQDLNNAPNSSNVVLPCSSFAGGGLWLKSTTGDCPSLDGTMQGSVRNLTLPGITFDPHQWHETRPWRGHRITIAIYTIKAVADLSSEHTDILRRLEFALPATTQ